MSRNIQIAFQVLVAIGQMVLPALPGAFPELTPGIINLGHALLAGLQAAAAIIAHGYNPDGTPATVAYQGGGMKIEPPKGE